MRLFCTLLIIASNPGWHTIYLSVFRRKPANSPRCPSWCRFCRCRSGHRRTRRRCSPGRRCPPRPNPSSGISETYRSRRAVYFHILKAEIGDWLITKAFSPNGTDLGLHFHRTLWTPYPGWPSRALEKCPLSPNCISCNWTLGPLRMEYIFSLMAATIAIETIFPGSLKTSKTKFCNSWNAQGNSFLSSQVLSLIVARLVMLTSVLWPRSAPLKGVQHLNNVILTETAKL